MARVHLALSDEQFFRLTPRQLHLLLDQHRERTKHQEWMTGILASTVANFSMQAPKQALRPADFMPSLKAAAAKKQRAPRINRKKIADRVREFLNRKCQAK